MEEGHVKRVQRDGSYGLWVEGNVSSLGGELQWVSGQSVRSGGARLEWQDGAHHVLSWTALCE